MTIFQTFPFRVRTLYATAAELAAENPVLLEGEPSTESDTGVKKIGDGVTAYNDLPEEAGGGGGAMVGDPQFIQDTQPTVGELAGATKYAWWDTSGGNLTLWIEDGT